LKYPNFLFDLVFVSAFSSIGNLVKNESTSFLPYSLNTAGSLNDLNIKIQSSTDFPIGPAQHGTLIYPANEAE